MWKSSILFLVYLLLTLSSKSVEYLKKTSSVFMGKDDGWEIIEESKEFQPFPVVSDSWSRDDTTLYLSIASFRDKLCPRTLFNVFSKARYPKRVSVGVVQQNAPGDIDCFTGYCELIKANGNFSSEAGVTGCPFEENVRMMRVDSSTAKGITIETLTLTVTSQSNSLTTPHYSSLLIL